MAVPMRRPGTGNSCEGSATLKLTGMKVSRDHRVLTSGWVRAGVKARQSCRQASVPSNSGQASLPWHCLYFLPLPQGQGSLRPTLGTSATRVAGSVSCETLPSSFGWV